MMTELVHSAIVDGICVVTLDNPPVNALAVNKGLVQGIYDALAVGERDPAVRAFVIMGAGRNFCGGADISEFGAPYDAGKATVPDLAPFMDTIGKPIVAGLHGATMGGGLELALACHYRVALPGAQIALPEVKLGVLPAAGGTQRIARLLGAQRALDFVIGGDPVTTEEARVLGIVDEIVTGDLRAAAIEYARRIVAEGRGVRRACERSVALERPAAELFADIRKHVAIAWRGYPAPLALVQCIETAATRPFAEGIALEARLFDTLVATPESQSLRHLFFAERKAGRVDGLPDDTPARAVRKACVVGANLAGAAIAMNFATAGIPVTLVGATQSSLAEVLAFIRDAYASAVAKGKLFRDDGDRRLASIRATVEEAELADVDIAIDAMADDLDRTRATFARLDRMCQDGAVLAANTANLDVNAIAAATERPDAVVGMHFFSPAHVMRLVEVARGDHTAPSTIATAMVLAKRLRKVPVCVGGGEGFVGNRMLHKYLREAEFLVEEGATITQVDAAVRAFGWPMGPFQVADLIGLDVGWNVRRWQAATRNPAERQATVADALYELGLLGQKTGAGYYRYERGSRAPLAHGTVDAVIERAAKAAGIARRAIGDDEIIERLMFRLVDEGARILTDGIAQRASDIDVVYAFGYGFPRYRGGPMFYADTVGLDDVLGAVRRFHARHGDVWTPAPLLVRKAAEGGRFNE